mmetsp:Transcript_21825/g.33574  ORF Transcript_21825/g.33574 Transcript_21825/m.33574 type:complete len:448 (-) Transcript_21825:99-1442(-)
MRMLLRLSFVVNVVYAWVLPPIVRLSSLNSKPVHSSTLYGDWEPSVGGSYILVPPGGLRRGSTQVVHFLGGAFLGAASQLTYRYLCERISNSGYVVIATPYRLSFDYENVCDHVETSLSAALNSLGNDVDPDIICIGHSCGALLHALLATREEMEENRSIERARFAFISFNNKGATDAVPLFDELVVPLATEAMRTDSATGPALRASISALRSLASVAVDTLEDPSKLPIPPPPQLSSIARSLGLPPIARQSLEIADQLPELLQELADGAREFDPTPQAVRERLRNRYKSKDTLIVQFKNDDIDESDDLYATLRSSLSSQQNDLLVLERLEGTHLTPLTQDIFLPASAVSAIATGQDDAFLKSMPSLLSDSRQQWLGEIDQLCNRLDSWLMMPVANPSPSFSDDDDIIESNPIYYSKSSNSSLSTSDNTSPFTYDDDDDSWPSDTGN